MRRRAWAGKRGQVDAGGRRNAQGKTRRIRRRRSRDARRRDPTRTQVGRSLKVNMKSLDAWGEPCSRGNYATKNVGTNLDA